MDYLSKLEEEETRERGKAEEQEDTRHRVPLYDSYLFQQFSVSLRGLLDEVPHSPALLTGHHYTRLPKCHCHLHDSTLHFIQNAGPPDVSEDTGWLQNTINEDPPPLFLKSLSTEARDVTKQGRERLMEGMQGH